jgi:hypothetical protein
MFTNSQIVGHFVNHFVSHSTNQNDKVQFDCLVVFDMYKTTCSN